MALGPMGYESEDITTRTYSTPSISMSAGTIGAWAANTDIDVSLAGYTPIQVCLRLLGHPASYIPVPRLYNDKVYISVWRATTAAYTIPAGDIGVIVLYQKN